jgi:Zn-dependent metalloprotease
MLTRRHRPRCAAVDDSTALSSTTRSALRAARATLWSSLLALSLGFAPAASAADVVDESMLTTMRASAPAVVVERSPLSGRVTALSELAIPTNGVSAEQRVRAFIASHPALARGAAARLVFAGTSESQGLVVARFIELHEGLPVDGSELVVTLDGAHRVTRVQTSVHAVTGVLAASISDEDAAKLAVSRAIGVTLEQAPPYRVVIAARPDGTHVRAVRVVVARPGTFDARAVLVDTASGEIHSSQPATVR